MKKLLALTTALVALTTGAAQADSLEGKSWDAKERFMIRARIIDVVPGESSSTTIGGSIDAGDSMVPEVDFTYFFTDNIAAELIAATSNHDMAASNTALGNVDLGNVWVLPPTLTLQYHFNPHGEFRPYVGAGVNYMYFYSEDSGSVASVDYEHGFGTALQAGMDVEINDNWAWNVDVKKVWNNVDAKLNGGAVRADVDLDPWIFGTGLAYRF